MQCKYCETSIPVQGVHYSGTGVATCQKADKMPDQVTYVLEKQPPVTFSQLKPGDYFRWGGNDLRMMALNPVETIQGDVLANAVYLDTGETTVVPDAVVVNTEPVVSM